MNVHHVALRTRDVDGLAAFYRRWLAFDEVRDLRPRSVWLRSGGAGAVLMIERADDHEPRPPAGGKDLLAFAVDPSERARLRTELVSAAMLEAETEHTLYFRDPDGRRIGVSSHPLTVA